MGMDMIYGKNYKGYPDPTAETAIANVERQRRGLQSRMAGEYFEGVINASLEWYKLRGTADIEKTPEPMKPLGKPNRKGQFLACYTKAAQPDYKGTLYGGQSVVFEAKHTDTDRIEHGRLTKEQADALELHHSMGAIAFVLVSFGMQDFFRVPWTLWRDMKAVFGRKYIKPEELEIFRVPFMAGVVKLLDGIEPRREADHEHHETDTP